MWIRSEPRRRFLFGWAWLHKNYEYFPFLDRRYFVRSSSIWRIISQKTAVSDNSDRTAQMNHCINMNHVPFPTGKKGKNWPSTQRKTSRTDEWDQLVEPLTIAITAFVGIMARGKLWTKVGEKEFSEISTQLTFSWQPSDKVPKGSWSLHFQWEREISLFFSLVFFFFQLFPCSKK